jgi:prepilin-type N-terminal cleavage/methylation domain-containing protein
MSESNDGFTLIEVLMALVLIGVSVLAAAPMFMYAIEGNAAGADLGSAGAVAVERMEELRGEDYEDLALGGSLDANEDGFFSEANPDFLVRWMIEDNDAVTLGTRIITVRVIANREVVGEPKEVTLTAERAR